MPRPRFGTLRFRGPARLLAALLTATLAACTSDSPTAPAALPSAYRSTVETTPESGPWARIVTGETGPGSLYAVHIPRDWHGDLVVLAHGFRDAVEPITIDKESYLRDTRDLLGAQGYAVAVSSYSENGFAVKDGAQRTHQLRGLAAAQLGGQPRRTFLIGFSLGSAVALSLAEQYPTQYDGALLACGMVGGSLTQTQYLGHVRVLFDAAYPNLLSGDVLGVPTNYQVNPGPIVAAITANPAGMLAIASTRQAPLPFMPAAASATLTQSLITALSFHARGINNITELVNGKAPFGNADETYTLGTPVGLPSALATALIANLNVSAGRFTLANSAQLYLERYYTPTGDLRTKVLTIHNRWDPVVPAFHEDSLAAAVTRAGAMDNLVQRRIPNYGHCTFTGPQMTAAFADLEGWSRTGVRP